MDESIVFAILEAARRFERVFVDKVCSAVEIEEEVLIDKRNKINSCIVVTGI